MKFASVLRNSAEELPDLQDLFKLYKQLKKSLKRLPNRGPDTGHSEASQDTQPSALCGQDAQQQAAAAAVDGAVPSLQALAARAVGGLPLPPQLQTCGNGPNGQRLPQPEAAGGEQPNPTDAARGDDEPAPAAAMLLVAGTAAAAAAAAAGEQTGCASGAAPGAQQAATAGGAPEAAHQLLDEQEIEFLRTITEDVQKLNDSYIEKEELNVIKLGTLEEKAAAANSNAEVQEAYKAFVDFHGELLLLLHWSILAYTGLVKILKKHHKRTGLLLRAPHLENLLSQPFCSVEVTCDMVRRAEAQVNSLATRLQVPPADTVAMAAGAAAAAAAGLLPAETVNSPFYHVGSGNNLRAMAEAAAAAAAVSARMGVAAVLAPALPAGAGPPADAGSGACTGSGAPPAAAAAAEPAAGAAGVAAAATQRDPVEPTAAALGPAGFANAAAATAAEEPLGAGAGAGAGSLLGQKRDAEEAGVEGNSDMMRRTRAALNVWQQLRVTAVTPSTVLPVPGERASQPAQAASGMTNHSAA